METQKPKKALRNLFSRTEPAAEEPSDIGGPNLKLYPEEKKLSSAVLKDSSTSQENSSHKKAEAQPQIALAPDLQPRHKIKDIEMDKTKQVHEMPKSADVFENPTSPLVKAEEKTSPEEHAVSSLSNKTTPYSFVKIQYNLDLFQAERGKWAEQDYVSFINRIDQAQTDAFFLKGKLVSEIKERFYLNNKRGWALFCDETLNMNYTTANQYIRVSQEFDVTSHQRRDFGFEHFKALLPLPKDERTELLVQSPNNLSVKSLRGIVAKKLQSSPHEPVAEKDTLTTKSVVETLQKLKLQLTRLKNLSLNQEEKWQLYGAFQNLSDEMKSIASTFSSIPESKNEGHTSNSNLQHN